MQTPKEPLKATKEIVQEALGGPARFQIIVVLAAILGLDTADTATMSAAAGSIEKALNIGNTEFGLLISVVYLVGAVFTLPNGSQGGHRTEGTSRSP